MKKIIPVYPFLIAIYPVLALYAQNPGEITILQALRPLILSALVAGAIMALIQLAARDWLKSAILAGFLILYLSSSGHVYRILQGYFPTSPGPWLHVLLIILELCLVIIIASRAVWTKYLPPPRVRAATLYLNIVAALLLILPLFRIGRFLYNARDDSTKAWPGMIGMQDAPQSPHSEDPPDIYYIIVDGYGRSDVLEGIYNYDNSALLDSLTSHGFYVAGEARSNYIQSPLSFSSSLNFDYINFAGELAGPKSIDRMPLFGLIKHSRARTLLEGLGYRTIAISSDYPFSEWTDADVYLSPFYNSGMNEIERFFLSTTAFSALEDFNSPFSNAIRYYLPLPGYETHRARIVYAFQALQEVPDLAGPKFVFVHIVAPHPPFVLDADGNPVQPDRPYTPGDGEAFAGNVEEYQQGYREQIQYVDHQLILVVNAILEKSSRPPVIIIQGDHGPGSLLGDYSLQNTCLWERTSILNAYYFPGGDYHSLYPSITPVNLFRVVFNTLFETDYELLPDLTFHSPQAYPYQFTDVTDAIQPTCNK